MDPDDFQFKPLNEGLGFYKKRSPLNLDVDDTLSEQKLSEQADHNPSHQTKLSEDKALHHHTHQQRYPQVPLTTQPNFQGEMNRNTPGQTQNIRVDQQNDIFAQSSHLQMASQTPTQAAPVTTTLYPSEAVPLSQKQISQTPMPQNSTSTISENPASSKKQTRTLYSAPHLGSFLLDAFVFIGLLHIFIFPLLLITDIDPFYILTHVQGDPALQISLGILSFAVLNFYLMTSRSFFGATLGEWACDIALGDSKKRTSPVYPILVAWRCFVMNITGVITLPLLGLITRSDLLGMLSFVRLTKSE